MMIIEFRFSLGDSVRIKGLDSGDKKSGHVAGCCIQAVGITYQVVWWNEGRRNIEWLYEWEIEDVGGTFQEGK